jgi:hypothetical protein
MACLQRRVESLIGSAKVTIHPGDGSDDNLTLAKRVLPACVRKKRCSILIQSIAYRDTIALTKANA